MRRARLQNLSFTETTACNKKGVWENSPTLMGLLGTGLWKIKAFILLEASDLLFYLSNRGDWEGSRMSRRLKNPRA